MKFCKYCGTQLADNQVCTCPQAQQEAAQSAPQPVQQYQAAPQQAYAPAPKASSIDFASVISSLLDTLKGFFTMNFAKTLKEAKKDKSILWVLLSGFAVLMAALASFESYSVVYEAVVFVAPFFLGLLASAIIIFGMGAGLFAAAKVYKTDIDFVGAMNVTTRAYLPVIFATVLSFITSLIAGWLTEVVVAIAIVMFVAYMYEAFQSVVPEGKSPAIAFVTVCAVIIALFTLVYGLLNHAAIESAISSAFSSAMSGYSSDYSSSLGDLADLF